MRLTGRSSNCAVTRWLQPQPGGSRIKSSSDQESLSVDVRITQDCGQESYNLTFQGGGGG